MADNVNINQGTTTAIATDDVASVHYQKVKLDVGGDGVSSPFTGTFLEVTTVPTVSSVSNLVKGTITKVEGGTVGEVTLVPTVSSVSNLVKGTITKVEGGTVGEVTLVPTVSSVSNLVKGTITKVEGGTVGEVTLVPTVTTVSNVTNGSINILTGTIQSSGTTTGVGVVSNLTNGSVIVQSGTLGSVAAVAQVHNAGTIQAGTVQVNNRPVTSLLSHGTLGTAGGSFFATISAASGAGTRTFVSNVDIVMQSGTADVRILAGTGIQGTGVIAAGQFTPGGGISKHMTPAFDAGDNSHLTYHFVGAGTAYIVVNYWKGT